MELVDANVVLRFLLKDHVDLSPRAAAVFRERTVTVLVEVLCEVVYVLAGVYGLSRGEIHRCLTELLKVDSVAVPDLDVALHAPQCCRDKNSDMVDCLLLAYREARGHCVHTFDRKLERLLASSTG